MCLQFLLLTYYYFSIHACGAVIFKCVFPNWGAHWFQSILAHYSKSTCRDLLETGLTQLMHPNETHAFTGSCWSYFTSEFSKQDQFEPEHTEEAALRRAAWDRERARRRGVSARQRCSGWTCTCDRPSWVLQSVAGTQWCWYICTSLLARTLW